MTFAAAETRSFERAGLVMRNVGDQPISAKTIERVVHDVGWELAERRDADPKTAENRGGVICLNDTQLPRHMLAYARLSGSVAEGSV